MSDTPHSPATAPIVTGAFAIGTSLTLQEWAWVIGIVSVVIGVFFGWRRDQREERKLQFDLGLRDDRRTRLTRDSDAK